MGHSERGYRYQIQCIQETIRGKERLGEDASFERGLLRAWAKWFRENNYDALCQLCSIKIQGGKRINE